MLGLLRRGVRIDFHAADRINGGRGWIAAARVRIVLAVGTMGVIMIAACLFVVGVVSHRGLLECLGK